MIHRFLYYSISPLINGSEDEDPGLMIGEQYPVHERVKVGASDIDLLMDRPEKRKIPSQNHTYIYTDYSTKKKKS